MKEKTLLANPSLTMDTSPVVLADSITHAPGLKGIREVVITGSHGGVAAAVFAIKRQVKGAIFNDAGVGKNRAGIAGLNVLNEYGVPAAAVDAFTARIGNAEETRSGRISYANRLAQDAGIEAGMTAEEAGGIMARTMSRPIRQTVGAPEVEVRKTVLFTSPSGRRIVAMDSNSMVTADHQMDVVMTGSHGGLLGRRPAIKFPVLAAFYNDAGVGKDRSGISRLPWLAENGIIGATVYAHSAQIGNGMETYQFGVISFVNRLAAEMGVLANMKASEAAHRIIHQVEK